MGITHKQRGFTIIEVSLFVAVAGLLLAGVMTGITAAVNQQRFHDTVNSVQNIIQQQFNDVQFVSNTSSTGNKCDGAVGGSTDCSIIGKLVDLGKSGGEGDGSVINSYDIIIDSDLPPPDQLTSQSIIDILYANNIRIIDNSNKRVSPVDWGGIIKKNNSGDYNRYLAIVQNPITNDIRVYGISIGEDQDLIFDSDKVMSLNGKIQDYINVPTCIISQDIISLKGTLSVAQGGSPDAVTVDFKGEDC